MLSFTEWGIILPSVVVEKNHGEPDIGCADVGEEALS